jgi:hypothetical protein
MRLVLRLGGADSGKIGEARLRIEGQDRPVGLRGMRSDDQIMGAAPGSSSPDMRDQPRP